MSTAKKQWSAIIIMWALFAMIAFVTNLCTPMATIIKNQGEISNLLAQIGNYGNFIAYLVMGIPAGMLIAKFGYKKTALIGLIVGMAGIGIQWISGQMDAQANLGLVFTVYLIGAFIAGLCMCILNCVVNPMLNILGGGGNKGNQYIQLGGVFNSTAAVACYILMGALIGEATKAKIDDATPALLIALAIFLIAFIVILFTKIDEPEQPRVQVELIKEVLGYRHFALGALAIFLYMGVEVGVPNYVQQYLSADNKDVLGAKKTIVADYESGKLDAKAAATLYVATMPADTTKADWKADFDKEVEKTQAKLEKKDITVASLDKQAAGIGVSGSTVGLIVAVYWFFMLIGRLVGASIGGKISSRAMITTVSTATLALVLFGFFGPEDVTVNFPGVDWGNLELVWQPVPSGIFALLLVGLCTSVMWGAIFNLAVEGLGKYTSIGSGIFMTMVFGCAVMLAIESGVTDIFVSYQASLWVIFACAAYILFYALVGSRVSKKSSAE